LAKQKKVKSLTEQLIEEELKQVDATVANRLAEKIKGMSFKIKDEKCDHPEVVELEDMIEKATENYRFLRTMNQAKDAEALVHKLAEIKFAKDHLIMVLNMDFDRPTASLRAMAKKQNIDLKDPRVIDEFKAIQESNLEDIRRLKAG
jgi:hypothetical protein